MPSPFPGMNPFLEHPDVWSTFHTGMLAAMADRLSAQVRPDYLVHMEAHLWIHERADDHEDGGLSRRLIGRSDVSISKSRAATSGGFMSSEAETAVLTPAMRILIPLVDIERQRYLEIRDRRNRELVAVVELLSPVNKKSGPYRAQYLTKRSEILASPAHLVEIDLLRDGRAMPDQERPSSTYGVMVSRVEERPAADFWPIGLRQPLPTIPVPLRQANSYASLELQVLLHQVYDRGTYAEEIYEQEAGPTLDPADLDWAEHVLSQAKL
ncbi:MAG: DUF4058 family protein [Isosphaeraceae bacterium]